METLSLSNVNAELGADAVPRAAVGDTNVTWFIARFPKWPGQNWLQRLVFPALMNLHKLNPDLRIDSVAFIDPVGLQGVKQDLFFKIPPEFESGRGNPWAIVVQWRRVSETVTPSHASTESWVKLIATTAIAALGLFTFRAFTQTLDRALPKLLNPGVMIAGLALAALIVLRPR